MKKLRPSTIAWLVRHGGIPYCTHTSDDYPRELEARGLITREGPGMLGHLHVLHGTDAGRALDLELADAALAALSQEQRDVLAVYMPGTELHALLAGPPRPVGARAVDLIYTERGSSRLKITLWGLHLVWREKSRRSGVA